MALRREEQVRSTKGGAGAAGRGTERLIARFEPAKYDTEPWENAISSAFLGVFLGFIAGAGPALLWQLAWPAWLVVGLLGALIGAVIGWRAGFSRRGTGNQA